MKRCSIKDIARLAGVSPSTVSFVLNGKAKQMRISATVEKKINQLATKHRYHPNQIAVSLRTGKSNLIGLVVETISGNFLGSLARNIEEEAELSGYKVVYCSTENQLTKGRELIRMLAQRQVDGYIITPTPGMEKDIEALQEQKRPIVLMDSFYQKTKVPFVLVDNYKAIADGMQHLFLKGLTRILFVTVDLDLTQVKEREDAFLSIMKEKKLPGKKWVTRMPYDIQRQDAINALRKTILEKKEVEALFFATNYLGLIGLETLQSMKRKIPGDVAVICFDDHDLFRLYPPGITVVAQPVEAIAKTAVQLLIAQLSGKQDKNKKKQLRLAAKIVIRGSTMKYKPYLIH
jgi:LacI family transcriptional regulator